MSGGIRLAQENDLQAILDLYAQDDFNGEAVTLGFKQHGISYRLDLNERVAA